MKTFRIGNTLDISWSIKTADGGPYRLLGADVSLFIQSGSLVQEIEAFSYVDGTLRFTFEGTAQRRSGIYALKLVENKERNSQTIIEQCEAFQLSDCTVDIEDGNAVEVDTTVNISQTIPEIQAGELERMANEQKRVTSEKERVSAESSRVQAEQSRVQEFHILKADSQTATANAMQTYLAIEIDEATGALMAVVGEEKTVFDSGEIAPDTGGIILNLKY